MAADAQLLGSAGNSATATVTSTAGNSTGLTKFLAVVQYFTNTANDPIGATPTDNQSNTYVQIGSTVFDPSGDDGLAMFLCEAGTGGASHTVSLTFSPTPFSSKITLYAITGCLATALDVHNTASSSSQALGSPISVATGALGQANEVIIAASCYDTSGFNMTSWTSSTMTVLEQDPGGNPTPVSGAVGKLTVASASTTTVGLTLNGTGTVSNALIFFATFKAAAAGTNENLTGQTGTFSEGTISRAVTYGLTGQTASFVEGTISASTGGNVTLSLGGQTAAFAEGLIALSLGYSLNDGVPLTGQTALFAEGTATNSVSYSLTGQTVTSAEGSLAAAVAKTLTGQTATLTEGVITAAWSANITLGGQTALFHEGGISAFVPGTSTASRSSRRSLFGYIQRQGREA